MPKTPIQTPHVELKFIQHKENFLFSLFFVKYDSKEELCMPMDVDCIHILTVAPFSMSSIWYLTCYLSQNLCVFQATSFFRYVALHQWNFFLYFEWDVCMVALWKNLCLLLCTTTSMFTKWCNPSPTHITSVSHSGLASLIK